MKTTWAAIEKAMNLNARIIRDYMKGGGMVFRTELQRVCDLRGGYYDDLSVDMAIRSLLDDGVIVTKPAGTVTGYVLAD